MTRGEEIAGYDQRDVKIPERNTCSVTCERERKKGRMVGMIIDKILKWC